MIRRVLAAAFPLAFLLGLILTPAAGAASKIAIAALGDTAAGNGVFVGPAFMGEPAAAGSGWIAFRAQVTEGSTTELIAVTNLVSGGRSVVASVGQTVSEKIGSVKQFLGSPAVNARGDVAFAAEITPPEGAPSDPFAPTPGGVFLWSQGRISVIVAPGFDTGFGILDLTVPINVLTGGTEADVAERTPALNDNGDVAFVAATFSPAGGGGAIFLRRAGQELVPVLKLGDPYGGGTFQILGPPALNNAGTLAFRGLVDGPIPLDGVFKREGETLSLLVRDGEVPDKLPVPFEIDPLFEFGDVVALNDAGDVACTGGPIFDNSDDANLGDLEGSPGVIVIPNGTPPLLVGFPGWRDTLFDSGRISDLALGSDEGSRIAPPRLLPDGRVVFFAQVNDGSSQVILRADPIARTVRPLVRLAGTTADAAPRGGTYQSASSAPAVDATGNLVFSARIESGTTSQALVWLPPRGPGEAISVGDAVPEPATGFYGGPAFFPPLLNDRGDVVFRSYVARGPALGIFRYRDGVLEPVVRVLDPAPLTGGARFTNFVGEPSINADGDIAFAATIEGRPGRGIFVSSGGTLRTVALPFDDLPDPERPEAFVRTIAANPSISDSGAVVFRGAVQYTRRFDIFPETRENCVFLADGPDVRIIAAQDQDSGTGRPFLTFRDPTIAGRSVLFRAPLGDIIEEQVGLFLIDPAGLRPVALEGEDLGGMTLDTLQGKGLSDEAGNVFFSARVRFAGGTDGAIIRSGPAGFETVVQTSTIGPEGGSINSLGRPSVSSDGGAALRVGFAPFTGGVPGLFLARDGRLRSFLRIGEGGAAGIDGRITGLNQNVSLNRSERVAVLASVGGGRARSAIFLAAPTSVRVRQLAFRRGPGTLATDTAKPRDRIKLQAILEPGLLLPPASTAGGDQTQRVRRKTVTVTVADTIGNLWSGTLPAADVQLRGRSLVKKRGASGTQIGNLRVKFGRNGAIRLAVRSRPFDLSFTAQGLRRFDDTGSVILQPPFSVRVDLGEDGGSVVVPCRPKGRRFGCRS